MRLRVTSPADLTSALMFAVVGAGALYIAFDYPLGSMRRMGPGLFPISVSVLLIAVGAGLALQSIRLDREAGASEEERARARSEAAALSLPAFSTIRAAFFSLAALLVFALTMPRFGLVPATLALVLIATRAEPDYPLLSAIILAVAMAALSAGVFVFGLGLPFRLWIGG